jgi:hypothetical protein
VLKLSWFLRSGLVRVDLRNCCLWLKFRVKINSLDPAKQEFVYRLAWFERMTLGYDNCCLGQMILTARCLGTLSSIFLWMWTLAFLRGFPTSPPPFCTVSKVI